MINETKKRAQVHFSIKLLSFIAILFILDLAVGSLLKKFYFKQGSGLLYRTTYTIDSTTADILILGSSTANHHYIPELFTKELHLSCYNGGRDGSSILYPYAIFQGVLKRYNPKMVILDLYDHEFMKDQESYDRISSLLPYYNDHPEIRSVVRLKGPFEKYKLLSKIYPYNSLLFTIGVGSSDFNKNRKYMKDQEGYVPLTNVWNEPLTTDNSFSNYELDSVKINFLKSFITDCAKTKIKLYVLLSPKFINYTHIDTSIVIADRITQEFNVPFFKFTNDSLFLNHPDLFSDKDHLNDNGAKVFSEKVIEKIIQYQAKNSN